MDGVSTSAPGSPYLVRGQSVGGGGDTSLTQSIKNLTVCGHREGKRDLIVNKPLNVLDSHHAMDTNDGAATVNPQHSATTLSISDREGKNAHLLLNHRFNRSHKVSCGNVRKYRDDLSRHHFVGKSQSIISAARIVNLCAHKSHHAL